MKQYKLIAHQKDFSEEDLVFNPKDFPELKLKDVVEIYNADEKFSRLLLQVNSLKEDFQQRDTVSVEQGIASAFQLRTYADVYVNVIDPQNAALDSLELTFKDQYLERGDMWRLKKDLENSCVYLNKKMEFCGIRCQVFEMWAQGERVACGVVNDDTKIVFRSSTNLVYLFIQMSSEMWDVDINGDLYFEKAINGFFSDLFAKWKENASSHEVTIVLFSRTFYEAQSFDDFPSYMRYCIQSDYRGRFYEDFYSVAVQNERYDDWAVILVYLKKLFNNYQELVLQIHKRAGAGVPKGVNSSAAQGNFLEVLNMSLNVFEKHYLDRSFDRTGHLSVVITPGVGVFEVDRELTNLTKQRIIDNGVGSDLVCLGEQPLHAVPLFKFHNKNTLSTVDDYSMPHWINLSFYSSSKQASYSNFIPRIKLPPRKIKPAKEKLKSSDLIQPRNKPVHRDDFPSLVDYDDYDAQVFRHALPGVSGSSRRTNTLHRGVHRKKTDSISIQSQPRNFPSYRRYHEYDCSPLLDVSRSLTASRSAAITIPQQKSSYCDYSVVSSSIGNLATDNATPSSLFGSYDDEQSPPTRAIVGSAGSPFSFYHQRTSPTSMRPGRALINPFDPSHVTIKLTSNRRRWTHVFPLGPTGIFMQQHHYQAIPQRTSKIDGLEDGAPTREVLHAGQLAMEARRRKTSSMCVHPNEGSNSMDRNTTHGSSHSFPFLTLDLSTRSKGTPSRGSVLNTELKSEKSLTLLWGATGEQEWTPALTTGVDWKSLTIPACLPLTTDYFPDRRSLQNDYVVSDYDLIPDCMSSDLALKKTSNYRQLTTEEVFRELVCQRLQQGFQLIVNPRTAKFGASRTLITQSVSSPQFAQPFPRSGSQVEDKKEEYFLSIGRIFHKLTLAGATIKATCLKPRHPYPTLKISYRYRFKAPYSESYEVSSVHFIGEKLENFNWNYLDHYICCHSDGDFGLTEFLKYMRVRLYLLPILSHGTKKIVEGAAHCDVYGSLTFEEEAQLIDNFLKFVEVLNKFRVPGSSRKPRERPSTVNRLSAPRRVNPTAPQQGIPFSSNHAPQGSSALFRDRLDSNRPIERPRARTASKAMERVRAESGNGGQGAGQVLSLTSDAVDGKPLTASSLSLDTGTDNMAGGGQRDSSEDSSPSTTPRRLTFGSSSMEEIVEAMKQPQDGLNFLSNSAGLPALTFVSAEAVAWSLEHIEGVLTGARATALLQEMQEKEFICHSSGNPSYPFIHGFFLYYICPTDKEFMSDGYLYPSLGQVDRFQKEWFEVAIHMKEKLSHDSCTASFLRKDLPEICPSVLNGYDNANQHGAKIPLFKNTNLDISSNTKSNREEWGHVRYHGNYASGAAFELVLQWMVATGSIITELVHQNWARRATSFGFLLVPVPSDLFAVPFSPQSDPLRGSLFIPLNVGCLSKDGADPFIDHPVASREYRMFLLQETIARRFGFIPSQYDSLVRHDGVQHHHPQYVHTTGNMFLLITSELHRRNCTAVGRKRSKQENSPHFVREDFISKQAIDASEGDSFLDSPDARIGFYWSWNFMLSKRWKLGATGDDQFMSKVLNDFRAFCNNHDNRLKDFWDSCLKEAAP